MLFGIIEFSLLLRDHTVVASDVRIGVRMASAGAAAGPGTCEPGTVEDPEPPCTPESAPALAQLAADAIQRSGSAMPEDSINYILVYKANAEGYPGANGNETMPSTCAGVPNCVRFVWRKNANEFRYGGGAWNYKTISACFPGTGVDPLDRVGVYLNASHDAVTGLFGGFELSDHAVMEFEPLPAASCGPDI